MHSPLISTDELAASLDDPDLRIVDASWRLDGSHARLDFDQRRLPGAVFFDLDAVSDTTSSLPHMLPTAEVFGLAVGALGIAETDRIVIYDDAGLFSAPRVWWTFRHMGASRAQVLDGGLPKWIADKRDLEKGAPQTPIPVTFEAERRRGDVADLPMILSALTGEAQIVDARPAPRFTGEAAEPRPGLRSGHMPGAINLPFKSVITSDGTLLRGDALQSKFLSAGIDLNDPVITSCGSGVTAAVLSLALAELGHDSLLYDGAWAEWGGRDDTPVETG